jgi:hypothetical protein
MGFKSAERAGQGRISTSACCGKVFLLIYAMWGRALSSWKTTPAYSFSKGNRMTPGVMAPWPRTANFKLRFFTEFITKHDLISFIEQMLPFLTPLTSGCFMQLCQSICFTTIYIIISEPDRFSHTHSLVTFLCRLKKKRKESRPTKQNHKQV